VSYLSLYQTAFTAGEWSPKLRRRSDLQKYPYACDTLENMIVFRQGGVVGRAGTEFIAETKDSSSASRLVPMVVSSTTAYILEIGDSYIRFFKDRAAVLDGGTPYEVSTPWSAAEIDNLKFAQSADVMYITHPDYLPRKLARTSDTSWTLSTVSQATGPFLDENTTDTTITASALTGNGITLTASSSIFTADDVGTTWMLRSEDLSDLSKWEGNVAFALNDRAISRGKIYEATELSPNGKTGVTAPDHVEGAEWDGRDVLGIKWTYRSSQYAFVTITAFSSGTSVTANVVSDSDIPDGVDTSGTTKWSKPAWSVAEGYPTSVTFWQQRLIFSKLQTVYMSQTGDFENFSPFNLDGEIDFTTGITITLDDDQVDPIKWITQFGQRLLAATRESMQLIGRENLAEPLGADNIEAFQGTQHGTRDFVQPIRIGDAALVLDRSGTRLREVREIRADRLEAPDRSVFADHLLGPVAFEAAYAEFPHSLYWMAITGGTLACMTYEPGEEVYAWHRHTITDATVESIAVAPEPTTQASDDLYLICARTIGGATYRSVEVMRRPYDEDLGDDFKSWPALDACVIYDSTATTTITGLDHLEGETVSVLADGFVVDDATVSSGQITLANEASTVQVGLPFTKRVVPLSPDPGSQVGASQAHRQRAHRARVLLLSTVYAEVGAKGGSTFDPLRIRTPNDNIGEQVPPFTGVLEITPPGANYDTETLIEIRSTLPLPIAVRGIVFDMQVDTR